MKRGTTPTLRVRIGVKHSEISTIDFIFKQDPKETATAKLEKDYPTNVTYDSDKDLYSIPFTVAETRLFEEDTPFYMDTRITMTNNKIPETKIVTLTMNRTLFSSTDEDEDEDDD